MQVTIDLFLIIQIIPSNNLSKEDMIQAVDLFATSEYDYYGAIVDTWSDLEAYEKHFKLGNASLVSLDFSQSIQNSLCEGSNHKSYYQCLARFIVNIQGGEFKSIVQREKTEKTVIIQLIIS